MFAGDPLKICCDRYVPDELRMFTAYWSIEAPPLEDGALKVTVAVDVPVAVADPILGAPGTVDGVTALEDPEALEVP